MGVEMRQEILRMNARLCVKFSITSNLILNLYVFYIVVCRSDTSLFWFVQTTVSLFVCFSTPTLYLDGAGRIKKNQSSTDFEYLLL